MMKFRSVAFLVAVTAVGAMLWLTPGRGSDPADQLSDIRAYVEDQYGGAGPGGAVLVMRGDEILLAEGYGLADLEWQGAATADTPFRIGSVTKVFTAVAVLQLVEQGTVDLDAPLATYMPDLPGALGQPTIRQLLSHTSGLPDHFWQPDMPMVMRNPVRAGAIIERMADTELMFPPGAAHVYSNFNYVLLGALLEAMDAAGRDYGTYIEQELFAPLGMAHSYYDEMARVIPGRAQGYDLGPDGPIHTLTAEPDWAHGAGALLTSAHDMARFTTALRNGTLLSNDMRALAWTGAALADGSTADYGLGFNVSTFLGREMIWHSGSTNGFQATWGYMPEVEVTVAVFSNGYYRANTTTTLRWVMATLEGANPPVFDATETDDASVFDLQGTYELSDGRALQVQIENGARINLDGGRWSEMTIVNADLLRRPDTLGHIRFDRGSDGHINGVTYVRTDLVETTGIRQGDGITEAPTFAPLDTAAAAAIVGSWVMPSGDEALIAFDGEALTLRLPGQLPVKLFADGEGGFAARAEPYSFALQEAGDAASLQLYGSAVIVRRPLQY